MIVEATCCLKFTLPDGEVIELKVLGDQEAAIGKAARLIAAFGNGYCTKIETSTSGNRPCFRSCTKKAGHSDDHSWSSWSLSLPEKEI